MSKWLKSKLKFFAPKGALNWAKVPRGGRWMPHTLTHPSTPTALVHPFPTRETLSLSPERTQHHHCRASRSSSSAAAQIQLSS